jgi:hypothetical protein
MHDTHLPDNFTVYYAVDSTPGVDRVPIRVALDGMRTGATGTTHIHHTYDWVNFVTGLPAAALFDVPAGCVPSPQDPNLSMPRNNPLTTRYPAMSVGCTRVNLRSGLFGCVM